jgi:hypothetical protein
VRKNNGFSENNKDYRGCFKRKSRVCLRKNLCKSLHNSKSRSIFAPHLREDAFPKKIGSLGEWLKPAVC